MSVKTLEPKIRLTDNRVVEHALPAHLLLLAIEQCKDAGLELRRDVMHRLTIAAVKPYANLDMFSVARLAAKVEQTALSLMREFAPDNSKHALYVSAAFPLTLVDEGLLDDPGNMAVLVALLIMEDVKDDRPDVNGAQPLWNVNEALWRKEAGRMILRAQLQGLYVRDKIKSLALST